MSDGAITVFKLFEEENAIGGKIFVIYVFMEKLEN